MTPIQIEVRELAPVQPTGAEGPERPPPPGLLILETTQCDDKDDDLSGKCLMVEGKFKSPKADTVLITNSHITDTPSNSYKSLTTETDLKTNNKPINGLITYKPKTLPLHTSQIKVLY